MIKFLFCLIILLFSIVTRGEISMDFKNMQYNENYKFYMNVNDIYKSDYFILNLIRFIKLNMDVLSIPGEIDKLNRENNITFRFYPSKIVAKPILEGTMDYVIIISFPSGGEKGEYYSYDSWISRDAADKPWNKANIYGYYQEWDKYQDFGYFKKEDFEELGLVFKRKKLLKHLDEKEWLKYTSTGYKEFNQRVYDNISKKAYAIYEFETERNGHRLKLSFTVGKDKYIENPSGEDLPYEWSQLFIERID
ncbi:hypothetical protein HYE59_05575 [Aggregatibacter actinomycetemcomitans]|uniref:hypothetical protein n=1 Tax=Aggregatibacter actinomycetemcomitans TaxID=714 RepID=UPI00197B084D|nr:hypothetical protein [Aggregatibacter actinomycetemcomitans]MBN6077017.1 hypothetical protein [Aggregatibacter actinomycetemcomitans]